MNPVMPPAMTAGSAIADQLVAVPASRTTAAGGGKLAASARQFGAMFMTEMVRLARPENKAVGAFKSGTGERSWSVFMDQALGQAAAGQDGSGLIKQIQHALERAQGGSAGASPPPATGPAAAVPTTTAAAINVSTTAPASTGLKASS